MDSPLIAILVAFLAIVIAISLPLSHAIATAGEETEHAILFAKKDTSSNDRGLLYELFDNAVLSGSPPFYEGTTLSAKLSLELPQDVSRPPMVTTQHTSPPLILSGALKGSLSIEEKKKMNVTKKQMSDNNWYIFDCVFEGTSTGWVRIGSHIVCHDGNAYHYQHQESIPLLPNKQYAFHAIITSNVTESTEMHGFEGNTKLITKVPNLSVYWKSANEKRGNKSILSTKAVNNHNGENEAARHPLERGFRLLSFSSSLEGQEDDIVVLRPSLPPHEKQRQDLQNHISRGWGHWLVNDLLSLTKLPEGIVVGLQICTAQGEERDCVGPVIPDSKGTVKVDRYSTDRSYASFNITFTSAQSGSISLTMEFSMTDSGHEMLQCLITVTDCDSSEGFVLEVLPRYAWFRPGEIAKTTNTSLTLSTPGLPDIDIHALVEDDKKTKRSFHPTISADGNYLTIPLPPKGHKIGLLAGSSSALSGNHDNLVGIERHIRHMDIMDESAMKEAFGTKHQVAQAIRAAVMWSCIYNPIEEGSFMPVSRSWASFSGKAGAATPDWNYVLFEWDNLFASLMAGLFDKNIAYSNLFVLVRSKTPDGFLPNWSTAGGIRRSGDRTEPPVGAKVLLELYRKYNDSWIVEALWEDIAEWNDWFMKERFVEPFGLIGLGSYENRSSSGENEQNTLQAARYESGLDNSPMYDGDEDDIYDKKGHMMQMYDVGMSSLVANEAYCLAELADAVGIHSEKAQSLRSRGDRIRNSIWKHLWDPKRNIFANRYKNSSFVPSIAPTSFYPLLLPFPPDGEGVSANVDASTAIESMIGSWLLNSTRFCLSPNGDFERNDPNLCYWGLPSVSADDPTYMVTGHWNYWRGLVWGPMAQIVYWSLQGQSSPLSASQYKAIQSWNAKSVRRRRESSPSTNATIARKSLCWQMEALMMSQWNENRHICENYSPFQNATECSGTLFYHWGALNGLIGMVEDGYYYEESDIKSSTEFFSTPK